MKSYNEFIEDMISVGMSKREADIIYNKSKRIHFDINFGEFHKLYIKIENDLSCIKPLIKFLETQINRLQIFLNDNYTDVFDMNNYQFIKNKFNDLFIKDLLKINFDDFEKFELYFSNHWRNFGQYCESFNLLVGLKGALKAPNTRVFTKKL